MIYFGKYNLNLGKNLVTLKVIPMKQHHQVTKMGRKGQKIFQKFQGSWQMIIFMRKNNSNFILKDTEVDLFWPVYGIVWYTNYFDKSPRLRGILNNKIVNLKFTIYYLQCVPGESIRMRCYAGEKWLNTKKRPKIGLTTNGSSNWA